MTPADAFRNSGLDYHTWAQRKVDEGKMFFPENRTVQLSLTDATGARNDKFSIKNIACEVIGGKESDYNTGKDRFCRFLDQYAEANTHLMYLLIQNTICDDGGSFACDLGMAAFSAVVGQFRENNIPAFCGDMFDAVWDDCGGVGGTGELWAANEGEDGVEFGFFQSIFYTHDDGATCSAGIPEVPDEDEVCRIEDFS
jgi:hypothetical protein